MRVSRKEMVTDESFVAIGGKWIFELPDVHFSQSEGPSYMIFEI